MKFKIKIQENQNAYFNITSKMKTFSLSIIFFLKLGFHIKEFKSSIKPGNSFGIKLN